MPIIKYNDVSYGGVEVINDLTHTDTNKALSANMGKTLNDSKVDNSISGASSLLSNLTENILSLSSSTKFPVKNSNLTSEWKYATLSSLDTYINSTHYTESEVDNLLSNKVDVVSGKGLSTNDYTTAEKNKLSGIASGAEVNVQADWNETDSSSDSFIKNKPNIPPSATVDTSMSDSSGNAVQNKVIKAYVDNGLANKMNSSNPVGTGSFSLNRKADTTVGTDSFAEGYNNTASGNYSHAEGNGTTASNLCAHAEGTSSIASGNTSHAEGWSTIASDTCQHVQGKFNVEDTNGKYADIVGGGSSTARANIETTSWQGVKWLKSDVRCGGNSQDDANAISLATLNNNVNALGTPVNVTQSQLVTNNCTVQAGFMIKIGQLVTYDLCLLTTNQISATTNLITSGLLKPFNQYNATANVVAKQYGSSSYEDVFNLFLTSDGKLTYNTSSKNIPNNASLRMTFTYICQ